MKKKGLLFILLFVLFIGRVSAEKTTFEAKDFFTANSCQVAADNMSATCGSVEYTIDLTANALVYNTDATTVKQAVESSAVLAYIAGTNEAMATLREQYKSLKENYGSNKDIDYSQNDGCDLENLGYCYQSGDTNTMKVAMNDTFLRFLIKEYGGTIDDGGSKASTDPGDGCYACEEEGGICCPEQQQQQQGSEDSSNPETGSFAEYGFIGLLVVALIVLIILKRRSEIEFKI